MHFTVTKTEVTSVWYGRVVHILFSPVMVTEDPQSSLPAF